MRDVNRAYSHLCSRTSEFSPGEQALLLIFILSQHLFVRNFLSVTEKYVLFFSIFWTRREEMTPNAATLSPITEKNSRRLR